MNINLKSIETIVLHCASRHDRRAHMDALLQSLGMNYSFFNAYEQGGRVLSATRSLIALIEQRLLITPFRPFLLLEDDISVTPWTESLDIPIPNDADAIYLGISLFSVDPLVEKHTLGVPYATVEGFRDLVKIDSMLSQHAVLILKPRWLLMLMRAMVISATLQLPWDIPIARAMSRYQVYAKYAPIFYQDASVGGQQDATLLTFDHIKKFLLPRLVKPVVFGLSRQLNLLQTLLEKAFQLIGISK